MLIIIQHKLHPKRVSFAFFSQYQIGKKSFSLCLDTVEYNIPVTVMYQRFQSGVDFQGELSKYYNPTYFFLQISNQRESYDEMHRDLKSVLSLSKYSNEKSLD